jgi:RNA polymerase sigma factor (sigma-70 family)
MRDCQLVYHRSPAALCLVRRKRQDFDAPDPPSGRKMVHMADSSEVSRLVRASADGSAEAWNELVRRYAPLVMAVARSYQLTGADAQDVSQTVWLRLVEHLSNLREPDALPGWLVTTTQRECHHHARQARRLLPVDPQEDGAMQQHSTADPDAEILRAELHQALRDGMAELPARDQWLLRLRSADPPMPYHEISELVGMPIGSIGPTLQRCLTRLRETTAVRVYLTAGPRAGRGKGDDQRELAEVD